MYQHIDFDDFVDGFRAKGRNLHFSYRGLRALFDHYEQLEEDTDTPIAFDVIAICSEYDEYASALEAATDYGYRDCETEQDALDLLNDETRTIPFEDGILVATF